MCHPTPTSVLCLETPRRQRVLLCAANSPVRKEPGCVGLCAKSLQSCPTLCDPIDGSPPGSPVPEILQGRTLEWVAISFSKA